MKFINYYDVLHISEHAPPEVIRAAYKGLVQVYHPDKYKQADAEIKMHQIREAYEILIDPIKRQKYDEFLKYIRKQAQQHPNKFPTKLFDKILLILLILFGLFFAIAIIYTTFFKWNTEELSSESTVTHPETYPSDDTSSSENSSATSLGNAPDTIEEPVACLERFPKAPNNLNWPRSSGYLRKMPVKNLTGNSTLTIDNSQVGTDVYIKLWDLETTSTVRHFLVKAYSSYTIVDINPSHYTVRAKFLNTDSTCETTESESFNLTESIDYDGNITYSQMQMTLYKVANGNMDSKDIPENTFDEDI